MAKLTARDATILVNGFKLSTFMTAYEAVSAVTPIDVTGFTDGSQNYIPGIATPSLSADALWSSTAGEVNTALGAVTTGQVTLIPEVYVLGANSLSMPFMQENYSPKGDPNSAIQLGSIKFDSNTADGNMTFGWMLAQQTITDTTTTTGVLDPTGAAKTAICGAVLHIWGASLTDTYVIKVQHSTAVSTGYADLITFTADGTALVAERQVLASGTVNKYRRIVATVTGAANDPLSFSVHFFTK